MSGPALGELVCELTREGRRLEARRLAALAAFDASGQWAIDGATSAGAWMAKETLCDTGHGHRDARLARRLRDMPETAAALAAGDISSDHAHAIAAGKHVEGFAAAEPVLVGQARGLRPSETRVAVTFWREVMGDERLPKGHDRQELFLSPRLDEHWDVRGTLVGESGAIADRALRHYMDHEPAGRGRVEPHDAATPCRCVRRDLRSVLAGPARYGRVAPAHQRDLLTRDVAPGRRTHRAVPRAARCCPPRRVDGSPRTRRSPG